MLASVSILLLMESALKEDQHMGLIAQLHCFNPSFNGIGSERTPFLSVIFELIVVSILLLMESALKVL